MFPHKRHTINHKCATVCKKLGATVCRAQRASRALPLILLLTLLTTATQALAVERANLTDKDLNTSEVRFVSLGGSTLSFFDAQRRLQQAPLDDYLSLAWIDNTSQPQTARESHTLRLADGHVLPGAFAGIDTDGRILWKTQRLGTLTIELDNLLSFTITASPTPKETDDATPIPPTGDAADDIVTLANGDRMSGFVDALSPEALTLQIAGQNIPLTWDRIAGVQLANPLQPQPGVWLNLVDHTTVRVERLTLNRETASARAFADQPLRLPADAVASVIFSTRYRLVPLSELEYEIESGGSVFAVDTPPRTTTHSDEHPVVHLHAPITVRYQLPRNALRFGARAWLDKQDLQWAHLVLAVSDDQGEHIRQTLGPEQPVFQINVPLRERHLIIQLEEGLNGPIRDRLKLSNAAVLVPVE